MRKKSVTITTNANNEVKNDMTLTVVENETETEKSDKEIKRKALVNAVMDNLIEMNGVTIATIPVEILEFDHEYQRKPKAKDVHNLIRVFDNKRCGFILVSYRNGHFYVIDGQHRVLAYKYMGLGYINCIVIQGLTQSEEAKIFSEQGTHTVKLNVWSIYKANICNGDTSNKEVYIDMEIGRICNKYGVNIGKVSGWNKNEIYLRSLSRARQIVKNDGTKCFEWILKTINASHWSTESKAYEKEIMIMFRKYYIDHASEIKEYEKYAKNVLNTYSPLQVIGMANAMYANYRYQSGLHIVFSDLTNKEREKVNIKSAIKIEKLKTNDAEKTENKAM